MSADLGVSGLAAGPNAATGDIVPHSLGGTAQASFVLSSNEIEVIVPSPLLTGRWLGRTMEVNS